MFNHKAYFIETLTNTHVGSGDTSFGIVDKAIQKDPVTRLPVFHPTSIKGAVRDHFYAYLDENEQAKGSMNVKKFTYLSLFGSQEIESLDKIEGVDNEKELMRQAPQQGLLKFYEARLLTLPLRSSERVYQNATAPSVVLDYLDILSRFDVGADPEKIASVRALFLEIQKAMDQMDKSEFIVFGDQTTPVPIVEEYENGVVFPLTKEQASPLPSLLSPRPPENDYIASLAVFKDAIFSQICETGLPVIARNSLDEHGISKNLFYEEVLPRRSVLWFMTGTYHLFSEKSDGQFSSMFEFFEDKLTQDRIQMGANASVGYGVTAISRINGADRQKGGASHE